MPQYLRLAATGVFQGVCQDRQKVEGTFVVDGFGEAANGAVVPRHPRWLDGG
jgi:hypothetical protein